MIILVGHWATCINENIRISAQYQKGLKDVIVSLTSLEWYKCQNILNPMITYDILLIIVPIRTKTSL